MSSIPHSDANIEQLFLIGIRLQPERPDPDLYAIVLYYEPARKDGNRPLTSGGRIVLFDSVAKAAEILSLGDIAFRKYGVPPTEPSYVYDVPGLLQLVEVGDFDDNAIIVNFLNEMMDFVQASGHELPPDYRAALSSFADWLTFNKAFAEFFHHTPRATIKAAILWCIGAIATRTVVV